MHEHFGHNVFDGELELVPRLSSQRKMLHVKYKSVRGVCIERDVCGFRAYKRLVFCHIMCRKVGHFLMTYIGDQKPCLCDVWGSELDTTRVISVIYGHIVLSTMDSIEAIVNRTYIVVEPTFKRHEPKTLYIYMGFSLTTCVYNY